MKINSLQLEAFFAVARHLNFTKAADSLHVTQSALSQRIAKLEDELETTLFVRDRSALRLTDVGEEVLRYCQLHEAAESDLLSKLKGSRDEWAGTLRVGGFSSVNRSLVIPSLKKIMQKNPKLSLMLVTKEIRDLDRLLRSAEVDYIVTNRKSDAADIESVFLGIEENVLVESTRSEAKGIYLDHDEYDPVTKSYFKQNKMKFDPLKMRYLDDVYGLIDGAKNGFGRAVVPKHLIEDEKDLAIIDPKKVLKVSVYLQFYAQPYYRRGHDEFVGTIRDYFGKRLSTSAGNSLML